jgi:opacity protein-like surface antigen
MKKLLAAAAGIVALGMTGSAFAADLPPPLPFKAPLPPPWYDWTGFYIGANGGYSWGRASNSITAPGIAGFSGTQNLMVGNATAARPGTVTIVGSPALPLSPVP